MNLPSSIYMTCEVPWRENLAAWETKNRLKEMLRGVIWRASGAAIMQSMGAMIRTSQVEGADSAY